MKALKAEKKAIAAAGQAKPLKLVRVTHGESALSGSVASRSIRRNSSDLSTAAQRGKTFSIKHA